MGAPAPLDEYYAKYGWTHVNAFYKAATPAMAISIVITGTWVLQDMIRGAKFGTREVAPGKDLDPAAKAEFVKNGATTFFHQAGTARMGKEDSAVVGADLKVKGIEGLRIVDGSIMPRIVTCATMATCVVIGERGAELILGA